MSSKALIELRCPMTFLRAIPLSFSGSESISRPFRYHLGLNVSRCIASIRIEELADSILGSAFSVGVRLADGSQRWFNGVATDVSTDLVSKYFIVQLESFFSTLDTNQNSRVFVDSDTKSIVDSLLHERGFASQCSWIGGMLPKSDLRLQFNESDLAFIERLLVADGVSYYFDQTDSESRVIFQSTPTCFPSNTLQSTVAISTTRANGNAARFDTIDSLTRKRSRVPGRTCISTFNASKPNAIRDSVVNSECTLNNGAVFRHVTSSVPETSRLEGQAAIQQEAFDGQSEIFSGVGSIRTLQVGRVIHVESLARDILITSVEFHSSVDPLSGEHDFVASFEAIPAEAPYRPRLVRPCPIVPGVVPAVVAGSDGSVVPSGSQVTYADEYGRVRIRFPWDDRTENSQSSCWVPVLQFSAGRKRGLFALPRIGEHVIVGFQDGNVDLPIVLGSQFGPKEFLPIRSDSKREMFFGSRSSDGSKGSYLEISDAPKKESVILRAGNSFYERIEGITSSQRCGDSIESVSKDLHVTVAGRSNSYCRGSTVSHADGHRSFSSTGEIVLKAGEKMSIEAGGSSIVIDSSGVWINGSKIGLNSGGPSVRSAVDDRPKLPESEGESDA